MIVAAIDPASSKIAIAMSDAEGKRLRFFETKLQTPFSTKSCGSAFEYVEDIFIQYTGGEDVIVFIEAPVMVRNPQSVLKQAMVSGAIQAALIEHGCTVHLVPVTQWKKATVGKGNASKDDVRAWAEARRPNLKGESQDLVDAYCIFTYGVEVVDRATRL